MHGFRVCFLAPTGNLVDFLEFRAVDEAAALNQAELLRDGRAAELWRGATLVAGWPAASAGGEGG